MQDKVRHKARAYLVFTDQCSIEHSAIYCEQKALGRGIIDERNKRSFTLPPKRFSPWSLAYLIYNRGDRFKGGRVCIYCAACLCLIQTALYLAAEIKTLSPDECVWVRPAHCLLASCSSEGDLSMLTSVVNAAKGAEARGLLLEESTLKVRYVDRNWLERQLFATENNLDSRGPNVRLALPDILNTPIGRIKCDAVIMLGETRQTAHLLQSPPFSFPVKKPKATQIYHFKERTEPRNWEGSFVGTYTSRSFLNESTPNRRKRSAENSEPSSSMPPPPKRAISHTIESQSYSRATSKSTSSDETNTLYDA